MNMSKVIILLSVVVLLFGSCQAPVEQAGDMEREVLPETDTVDSSDVVEVLPEGDPNVGETPPAPNEETLPGEDSNAGETSPVPNLVYNPRLEGLEEYYGYPDFDGYIEKYGVDGCVVYTAYTGCKAHNISLFESWLEAYRRGEPASVALVLDARPFPSSLHILESDGTATFKITSESYQGKEIRYSSKVLKRDFDYVYALDIEGLDEGSILLFEDCNFEGEELDYDLVTLPSLGTTGSQEAIGIAGELVEALRPDQMSEQEVYKYRIIGAVALHSHPCYIIEAYTVLDPDNKFDNWRRVLAVNADGGNLIFMMEMMGGTWELKVDRNAVEIVPS